MSRREHLSLRIAALLLLAIAALWPRSPRGLSAEGHDPAVAGHVVRGRFETAAARPSADGVPRPRSARLVVADADETTATN